MSFTFLFHIFLAFTLLNTFHTYSFGGALFIMHSCPHSGCFARFQARAVKEFVLPSSTAHRLHRGQTAVETVPWNAFSYFMSVLLTSYDSQKRNFKRWWTNQLFFFFSFFFPVARLSFLSSGGSRAGLGRAAAGAGGALRAAGTVGRAAVLWGGRGLLDLRCAACLTCCQHRGKGGWKNTRVNDGQKRTTSGWMKAMKWRLKGSGKQALFDPPL